MRTLLGRSLILASCLLGSIPASAAAESPRTQVLIDGSGSMAGFFQAGSVQTLLDALRGAAAESSLSLSENVLLGFQQNVAEIRPLQPWLAAPRYGIYSPLEHGLAESFPKADWLFILTDNVQTGGETRSTETFYRFFKRPEVGSVHVAPLSLPFNGAVYFNRHDYSTAALAGALRRDTPNGRFGEVLDNGTNLVVPYDGTKGLLLYAIARSEHDQAEFEAFLARLKAVSSADMLAVKPIDGRHFELNGVPDPKQVLDARQKFPPPPEVEAPLLAPTLSLSRLTGTATQSALLAPMDYLHRPAFHLRRSNEGIFYFGLRSRLPHIVIGNSANPWSNPVTLSLGEGVLQAGGRDYRVGEAGEVQPRQLVGELSAVGGEGLPRYIYMGRLKFGPLSQALNPIDPLTYMQAFSPVPARLRFDLQMDVPSKALSLRPDYREHFFTRRETTLDKIFAPTDIIRYLASGSTRIPLTVHMGEAMIPDRPGGERLRHWQFALQPNSMPAIFSLLMMGLVLGGGALLGWNLSRRYAWHWGDGETSSAVLSPMPGTSLALRRNDEVMARLSRQNLAAVITPAEGYTWEDLSDDPRPCTRGGEYPLYSGSRHVETLYVE